MDKAVAKGLQTKRRVDWGLQNMIASPQMAARQSSAEMRAVLQKKIDNFCQNAFFPQQLTFSRQVATTKTGAFLYRELVGRIINGIPENGVRVVVVEHKEFTRFLMSPLFPNLEMARGWAELEAGVKL